MANSVCEVLLTEALLESAAAVETAATAEDFDLSAGAIVDFWGAVRALEDGREIDGIDYEAHRVMVGHQLRLVTEAAVEKFKLKKVIVHHRIGFVHAGEASLFLRVSAQHRSAAFEASKWIVDELKQRVPIWKRPKFKEQSRRCASQSEAATVK